MGTSRPVRCHRHSNARVSSFSTNVRGTSTLQRSNSIGGRLFGSSCGFTVYEREDNKSVVESGEVCWET